MKTKTRGLITFLTGILYGLGFLFVYAGSQLGQMSLGEFIHLNTWQAVPAPLLIFWGFLLMIKKTF